MTEDVRSFECALRFVPTWLAFLNNVSIQYYKGYDLSDIIRLMIRMRENGYGESEIGQMLSGCLESLCEYYAPDCIVGQVKDDLLAEAENNPWLKGYLPLFHKYINLSEDKSPFGSQFSEE